MQIADAKVCQNDLVQNVKMRNKISKQTVLEGGQTFMINDGKRSKKK